ncbi:hypothetical protein ACT6QH_02775 [Xanthobacter sp. TB0139]|uniref:hypothetical protein n=1 Tax=Xanthobacter sp. TB0139 TaxID=3459178 RepID=UPI00403A5F9E
MAIHEMNDAVMGTPKTYGRQNFVWITHEITIGEKEKLDQIQKRRVFARIFTRRSGGNALRRRPPARGHHGSRIYVSHIDFFSAFIT